MGNPFSDSSNPYGSPQATPQAPRGTGGDATGGIIPYKNGPALFAYYCAIFSLIPCVGAPLGLVAVVLGFIGLGKYNKQPEVGGIVHAWIGIVLGGLCCLGYTLLIALGVGAAVVS